MKLVLLASGNGSLAQAIVDARIAEILAVATDNKKSLVLSRFPNAKLIEFREPRTEWESELESYIASLEPDYVVSVGFMRILSPSFVNRFRVINTHPALLPNFPGAHAVADALAAGVSQTGSTVHWVDEGVDTGKIIAQVKVDVLPEDDEDSLHERIKIAERKLIVDVLKELDV